MGRQTGKHIAFGWYGGKYSHLDRILIQVRDEQQQRMETLLAGIRTVEGAIPLSAEGIVTLVEQHLRLPAYQQLLLSQPDSAVGQPLKEAWLALRQAAEARPDVTD